MSESSGVWASMPRPRGLGVVYDTGNLPQPRQTEVFSAGLLRTLARLFVWLSALSRFFGGILWDKLRWRDTTHRRARRLRRILERAGTTFIKLGQQLSVRIDVLPYEYALELEKMLDEVPFHLTRDEIEDIVNRTTGKPLAEIFTKFDPEPIGSASVACVYLAQLKKNCKPVAVKVRRPGIGQRFAADMRVLGWLLWLAECTFLGPGFSRSFLYEIREMLFEELDFELEARYTDLFRRRVKKAKMRFVTAPRVYFKLSGKEMIVAEFVSGGFWLKDIIKAIESEDQQALAVLKQENIKPKKVAQRLLDVARYGHLEGLLFHADLHPANILVRPNSKLTLIDFGSCSSLTEKERHVWRHFIDAQAKEDAGGMAQAALGLFTTIPPINLEEFTAKVEAVFWQDLYAHKSKDAAWWERTSANMWATIFELTREYRIPMSMNLLRQIRMTLLADTLAVRLHHKIDYWREYRRFAAASGKRAKRRLARKLKWFKSPQAFIRYEELYESGFSAFYRLQRFLDTSIFTLTKLEQAVAYGTALALRMIFQLSMLAALLVLFRTVWQIAVALPGGIDEAAERPLLFFAKQFFFDGWYPIVSSRWYLLFVLVVVLVNARRLLIRLELKETNQ